MLTFFVYSKMTSCSIKRWSFDPYDTKQFEAKSPSTSYNLATFWQHLGERSTKKIGPFSRDKEIMLCWNSFQLLCTSKTLESLTVKACRLGLKPEDISMNIFLMKYRISKGKLSLTILILTYLFYIQKDFFEFSLLQDVFKSSLSIFSRK